MAREVRKPPVGARLRLHKQGVRGWCGWCGGPVEEKTPGRGWLKWWHDKCAAEMAIIENPAAARDAVLARDHGICCDCGEDWSNRYKSQPGPGSSPRLVMGVDGPERRAAHRVSRDADGNSVYWCDVVWISLWHVDHRVPLWKVQHLPDLERLVYFMLANLVTRCHECHKRKTSDEAAERAHLDRLARTDPKKPKRKWGAREFPKGQKFPPKGSRPFRRR